jgi:hypothetical protein
MKKLHIYKYLFLLLSFILFANSSFARFKGSSDIIFINGFEPITELLVDAGIDRVTQVNKTITLVGSGINPDNGVIFYQWHDDGDLISTSSSFPYTPTTVGEHQLTLTIFDSNGGSASDSALVNVANSSSAENNPPTVDADLVKYTPFNQAVTITGLGFDNDGTIASYQWTQGAVILSNNATFDFTPTVLGEHILTLTVTDNDGAIASDDLVVFTIGGNATAITVNVTTVGGGGNYECDGIDDDVQINQALFDVANVGGGTVHIGAGIFTIGNPIEFQGDHTILEGEGMDNTTIKLQDEANWGEIVGTGASAKYLLADPIIRNNGALHNIALRNLKVDGNKYNQHYTHPVDGLVLVSDGVGNYDGVTIATAQPGVRVSNILISGVYMYENNSDAFIVFNGNHIIVEHSKTERIGHSATYLLDPLVSLSEYNDITIAANSGLRWYDGNHIIVRNNFIQGNPNKDGNSNFAIEVTSGQTARVLDDLIIENNEFRFTAGAAIALDAKDPAQAKNVIIRNNLIYQCGNIGTFVNQRETGAINLKNFTNTLIENNTLVNNIGSAIRLGGNVGFNDAWDEVSGLTAIIRNNIISNTIDDDSIVEEVEVYGIDIANGHSAICTYNNLWNNHTANYHNCEAGIGSISADPRLQSIALGTNFNNTDDLIADLHLQSEMGRWDEDTASWINDGQSSTSINAGAPTSHYLNEYPANGNRINLGAYGNTQYASKGIKSPPIAQAGMDQNLRADSKGYVRVTLDGSQSSDDGTIVDYLWEIDGIYLGNAAVLANQVMGVGIHNITLTVTDDDGISTADKIVVRINPNLSNQNPLAIAGIDQVVTDSDNSGSNLVLLRANDSSDADGNIVSFRWFDENGIQIADSAATTQNLVVGTHQISLTVMDNEGGTSTDTIEVIVKPENDYALNFGGGEFVVIENANLPSVDLTIEMWIKQNSSSGDTDGILNLGANDGKRLVLKTGGLPSWGLNNYSDTGITMGQWHHLAFVVENSLLTNIYIDGASQNLIGDGIITMSDAYMSVGSFYQGVASSFDFDGTIDELRVWNSPRTSTEINANKDTELNGDEPNLVGYWNFNDGSGVKLTDKAGTRDGNLTNMEQTDWVLGVINPH